MEYKDLNLRFESELEFEIFSEKLTKGIMGVNAMIQISKHMVENESMNKEEYLDCLKMSQIENRKEISSSISSRTAKEKKDE